MEDSLSAGEGGTWGRAEPEGVRGGVEVTGAACMHACVQHGVDDRGRLCTAARRMQPYRARNACMLPDGVGQRGGECGMHMLAARCLPSLILPRPPFPSPLSPCLHAPLHFPSCLPFLPACHARLPAMLACLRCSPACHACLPAMLACLPCLPACHARLPAMHACLPCSPVCPPALPVRLQLEGAGQHGAHGGHAPLHQGAGGEAGSIQVPGWQSGLQEGEAATLHDHEMARKFLVLRSWHVACSQSTTPWVHMWCSPSRFHL